MAFYDLGKKDRAKLVHSMREDVYADLRSEGNKKILEYFSDKDTHIRQKSYLTVGKLYRSKRGIRGKILTALGELAQHRNELVRQTTVHALGEIGKVNVNDVADLLEKALDDKSWRVRNAVVGSLKQMGEKNPKPTLEFAKRFIASKDPKVRMEVIHGIELRGRTHPQDVLPILEKFQWDCDKDVRKKIVHVIGQISYKKGCLEKVVSAISNWENKDLVKKAADEIIEVHKRYSFSDKTPEETELFVRGHL